MANALATTLEMGQEDAETNTSSTWLPRSRRAQGGVWQNRQSPRGTLIALFDFLPCIYFYLKLRYSLAYLLIVICLPAFYGELHKETRTTNVQMVPWHPAAAQRMFTAGTRGAAGWPWRLRGGQL